MPVRLTASLLIAAMLSAVPASAQSWPQRNVRFVLPLGPGAGADIGARLLADRLAKAWGQAVVVENRPGGDGVVAITTVLNANDDHIFLWGPSGAFVAHPYLHQKVPYDASQIVPIARVTNTLVSVSVPTASGIGTLAEFVATAKKEPGKLNWAAVTGLNDFQFQAFAKTAAIDIVRVPYRDGVQALNDLAEGRIHAYSSAYAISRPQVQAGKIKVIALTNTARADVLPGVPTAREAGHPALEFDGLVGLYSTPVVPAAIRDRISNDVMEAMKDPIVIDRLTATGQVVNPGRAKEFVASIDHQRAGAAETAKVLGLKKAD